MGEKEEGDTFSDKFLFCFCKFLKSQEILIGLHGAVHAPGISEFAGDWVRHYFLSLLRRSSGRLDDHGRSSGISSFLGNAPRSFIFSNT